MSWPVAIAWVEQTLDRRGWADHQMVGETPFCTPASQDAWLAAHPGALDPVPTGTGRRQVGQPYQWLDETGIDRWCAACGVLIQVGTEEAECPAGACPPLVVNRLRSRDGERCGACGRWQQLPARLLDRPGGGLVTGPSASGCGSGRRLPAEASAARPGHPAVPSGRGWSPA